MTERIVDISEQPARLSVRLSNLLIQAADKPPVMIPLGELASVVVSNPAVTYTHAALNGLAAVGATLVVCDEKHLPSAMLLPLQGNFVQAERFALQCRWSTSTG